MNVSSKPAVNQEYGTNTISKKPADKNLIPTCSYALFRGGGHKQVNEPSLLRTFISCPIVNYFRLLALTLRQHLLTFLKLMRTNTVVRHYKYISVIVK